MRELSLTASLLTAVVLAAAAPAGQAAAADLSGPPPQYDRDDDQGYGDGGRGGYDDRYQPDDDAGPPPSRYGDRYDEGEDRDGNRYGAAQPPPRDDDYGRGPPPGSLKDGYPVPVPPPRYGDRGPGPGRDGRYACLAPYQIDGRLHARGWIDVRPMGGNGSFVRIQARRPDSSSLFLLRVDRCSGDVASYRPMHTFAYAPRPWRRWDRSGY